MATHSSTLAWKIPWTEEPGRLQSMGSQRLGHKWVTLLTHTKNRDNAHLLHFNMLMIIHNTEGTKLNTYAYNHRKHVVDIVYL